MKLLQDPVPQPVNYSSMKSEEPSEKLNDKKNYDFLFVSNNLSKYLNFWIKNYQSKEIKNIKKFSLEILRI